jgi:hypothetical protein
MMKIIGREVTLRPTLDFKASISPPNEEWVDGKQ